MKAVVKMLVVGVVLTGVISTAGADTITIQGSDEVIDSFLLGSSSVPIDGNYGGSSRTTVDINGALASGLNRNGIFRWNLDNLPIDGNQITMVEIMFYVDNYNSASTLKYDLRQITGGDWGETTVTAVKYDGANSWANQTAYPWGDLSTETYGTVNVNTQNIWVTFNSVDDPDLLTLVQGMVDGKVSNHGFSVEGQSGTTIVLKLRSSDHGTASTQPRMVITYAPNPTVNIQGSDYVIDSFLLGTDSSTPSAYNYGNRTTVDVSGATISGYNRNGVFRWNLDNVSIDASQITEVNIMLYVDDYNSTSTRNYDLRQITGGDWVEAEVSAINRSTGPDVPWTNQGAYPWGDLSTETYGTVSVNTNDVWVTFSSVDDSDLLNLVQDMVDGTVSNHGFSVEGQSASSTVLEFRSTDHGTASTRPRMFIAYVIPEGTLIIIK